MQMKKMKLIIKSLLLGFVTVFFMFTLAALIRCFVEWGNHNPIGAGNVIFILMGIIISSYYYFIDAQTEKRKYKKGKS